MTRLLAILVLLWPMIVSAHAGSPVIFGDMAAVRGDAGEMPGAECTLGDHAVHAHCRHANRGEFAACTVAPEDRDDPGYEAPLAFNPPSAAGEAFVARPDAPWPDGRPRFILFGNFRS